MENCQKSLSFSKIFREKWSRKIIFFQNCSKKNLKNSEKFQQNFGHPNFFVELQNCPNFKSCVGNEPPRSRFLPKKQPNSKNRRILKSAWQSVTFALWACREKFNIDFLSQIFFLASPHVYWLRKIFWAKMSMLNFSRWLRNQRSSLKWQ